MDRLFRYMDERVPRINEALDKVLPHEEVNPGVLHEAMRYAVLGKGKRIRPLLVLMSNACCGGAEESALPAACALELTHTYSLVHDDLPAMDDDDLRRGKLSCHKAFSEAIAILAGDALQAMAFDLLGASYPPAVAAPACHALASAVGPAGMVGGQVLDLEGEGKALELEQVGAIHLRKTGALIAAACTIGGLVGGADEEQLAALQRYAHAFGLAFQIIDDVLDVSSTSEELGKTAGKDAAAEKSTYASLLGVQKAGKLAKDRAREAKNSIKAFGPEALMLRLLADYIVER